MCWETLKKRLWFDVYYIMTPEVGSNELHLLRYIYLSKFFG